jgi:predicted NUDIX family phosphoesterase
MTRTQVFVVDRDAFFGGDWPQGYHPLENSDEFLAQARSLGRFVDREEAEANPAWKQWIPYCMLRCGDWSEGSQDPERGVLAVQRTKKGGETRLHESWSIGLGGHIEPEDEKVARSSTAGDQISDDSEARTFFATALGRELSEELFLPAADLTPAPRLLGLINDDSTEVGKVHAGLAYCIDFPTPLLTARKMVEVREISKMRGGFTHLAEFAKLWQTRSQFESWSQFLIQAEITVAMGVRSGNGTDSAENEA